MNARTRSPLFRASIFLLCIGTAAFAEDTISGPPDAAAGKAEPAPSQEGAAAKADFVTHSPRVEDDLNGYVITAREAIAQKDWLRAEAAYHRVMNLAAPDAAKRQPMYDMGRMFESSQAYVKAAMVYEEFLDRFHDDPAAADVSLRLGRADRELGAFSVALNKFYNALNSSLRTGKDQKIALQAQFEIAQTHFAMGNYGDARRYFERLVLLDMSPDDHALVQFRLANATFLAGDYGKAVALCKAFVSEHPNAPQASETHYMLTKALQKLGRGDEATQEILTLLKQNQALATKDAGAALSWQKRTGTEIASELYDRGDAMNALTIYQKLAELDAAPAWRLPIVYQIGLCFERLRLVGKAMEAYTYIIGNSGAAKPAEVSTETLPPSKETADTSAAPPVPGSGTGLKDMAQWRIDYLRWATDTDRQISSLVKPDWNSANIQPLQFRQPQIEQSAVPTASR